MNWIGITLSFHFSLQVLIIYWRYAFLGIFVSLENHYSSFVKYEHLKFEISLTLFNDIKMSDGADAYPTGSSARITVRAIGVIASPWDDHCFTTVSYVRTLSQ